MNISSLTNSDLGHTVMPAKMNALHNVHSTKYSKCDSRSVNKNFTYRTTGNCAFCQTFSYTRKPSCMSPLVSWESHLEESNGALKCSMMRAGSAFRQLMIICMCNMNLASDFFENLFNPLTQQGLKTNFFHYCPRTVSKNNFTKIKYYTKPKSRFLFSTLLLLLLVA